MAAFLQAFDDSGARILGYNTHLPGWAAIPLFLVLWAGLTYGVYVALGRLLHDLVFTPGRRWWELVVRAAFVPAIMVFALVGLKLAFDSDAFPQRFQIYAYYLMTSALTATIVLAVWRFVGSTIDEYALQKPAFAVVHPPILNLARGLIIALGVLAWMEVVGMPITALMTLLGVGSLTLGFVLQDSLRNLLAGLHLALERPIQIGDMIQIEGGIQGTVVSVGWRTTRLRTAENSMIFIPNRRLIEGVVTNHSLPQKWILCAVPIHLPKEIDLGAVENAVRDELERAVEDIRGLRKEPSPGISPSPGYSPGGLEMTVTFGVSDFMDQGRVRDEIVRRVYDRLRTEGLAFQPRPREQRT